MTTLLLATLALLLAGPVPAYLVGLKRIRRSPIAAMVLWQSVALAAVLAALGAGLSLATWTGIGPDNSLLEYVVAVLALALTVTVIWRLVISGHRVGTELRLLRQRHRDLLDLLATEHGRLRVVEHETPTAYCVPGVGSSRRVVVSQGTLDVLSPEALSAVLEHERAHLRLRHDLVIEAFTVLHHAFPAVISSERALTEVSLLAEVLADRAAVRRVGTRPLVLALSQLVGAPTPQAAMGAASGGVVARLEVLRDERRHRLQSILLLAAAWALLVAPTVLIALPWLQSLPG